MTYTMQRLEASGILDDMPRRVPIRSQRKQQFYPQSASQVFDAGTLADKLAIARGRIIRAFADYTELHRGAYRPTGGVIRHIGKRPKHLAQYVFDQCLDNPFIKHQDLPDDLRKLSAGKQNLTTEALQLELINEALQPLYRKYDVYFMAQDGGEWWIAPHCLDELPTINASKLQRVNQDESAA